MSVHPDMTSTDLYRNADFKEDEDMAAHLEPQEVAQTVEYIKMCIRDSYISIKHVVYTELEDWGGPNLKWNKNT